MDFESHAQVGLMQLPVVVSGNVFPDDTSMIHTSRFGPSWRPNAIHFPSGDHEGQVSSNGWPLMSPFVRRISFPPREGTL